MVINNIDDLLKYLQQYAILPVSKSTSELEQRIIDEAERKHLVYQSSKHNYKLDSLGYDVLKSKLSWEQFNTLLEIKESSKKASHFDEAISHYTNIGYKDAAARKGYYGNDFNTSKAKPILFPIPPEVKVSKLKKSRQAVSRFLQHWFVEKYLKTFLYLIFGAIIVILIRYYIKLNFPFLLK